MASTPECSAARALRAKAVLLEHDGHEMLALANLKEANAQCPAERASSAEIEKTITQTLANDAPLKGTTETMRARLYDAWNAERAKDWAKAKGLYLEAWAEHHPMPRALESAGRMAGLGGDAAESRRLRDRALAEAEASEKTTAHVESLPYPSWGVGRLVGTTLFLDRDGQVIARDTVSGELRSLLRVTPPQFEDRALSPRATLAMISPHDSDGATLSVYDLLTGSLLYKVPKAWHATMSPDDKVLAVIDGSSPDADGNYHGRIFDALTGQPKTRFKGKRAGTIVGFTPDSARLLVLEGDPTFVRDVDLTTGAFGSIHLPASTSATTSLDGHYLVYLDNGAGDAAAVHVRDMTVGKEVASWAAQFHSVSVLGVSSDAKSIVTGSYNSLRLWDVAQKKQLFKRDGTHDYQAPYSEPFAFSDDDKSVVVGSAMDATLWDVAAGTEKAGIPNRAPKNILHVMKAPDGGAAIILEDEVRVVPTSGEPRTVCKGLPQPVWANPTVIGPTAIAFSATGKSFACAMWDGWVHVFDTATWTEKSVIKRGASSPIDRPVDLVFAADDATLTDVSNVGLVTYDAVTAKETKRTTFAHAGSAFAPRHARFDDGTIAVRTWNGMLAIFGSDGAWQRDVKAVAGAPATALDAFASSGKTYAVALQKTLHVVDLATGDDKTTELSTKPKSLAVSADGKTVLVVAGDGAITTVTDGVAAPLANAKGVRVGFAGKALLVWTSPSTVETYAPALTLFGTLDVDAMGLTVRDSAGGFDTRGKPEVVCVVGATYLSRATCDDRAASGLVAKWVGVTR